MCVCVCTEEGREVVVVVVEEGGSQGRQALMVSPSLRGTVGG